MSESANKNQIPTEIDVLKAVEKIVKTQNYELSPSEIVRILTEQGFDADESEKSVSEAMSNNFKEVEVDDPLSPFEKRTPSENAVADTNVQKLPSSPQDAINNILGAQGSGSQIEALTTPPEGESALYKTHSAQNAGANAVASPNSLQSQLNSMLDNNGLVLPKSKTTTTPVTPINENPMFSLSKSGALGDLANFNKTQISKNIENIIASPKPTETVSKKMSEMTNDEFYAINRFNLSPEDQLEYKAESERRFELMPSQKPWQRENRFKQLSAKEFAAIDYANLDWNGKHDFIDEQLYREKNNLSQTEKIKPQEVEHEQGLQVTTEQTPKSPAMKALEALTLQNTNRAIAIGGEKALNFVREMGTKYKNVPAKKKYLVSALMLGSAAGLSLTGLTLLATIPTAVTFTQRILAGAGAFVMIETYLNERKAKSKKEERWYNTSKANTAVAATVGIILGGGLLGKLFQAMDGSKLVADSLVGKSVLEKFAEKFGTHPGVSVTTEVASTPNQIIPEKEVVIPKVDDAKIPETPAPTPATAVEKPLTVAPTHTEIAPTDAAPKVAAPTPAVAPENVPTAKADITTAIAEKSASVSLEIEAKSSIWKTLANHIKSDPTKFGFEGSEEDKNIWIQKKVASILSDNPDVAKYNIVHPGDEIVVSAGDDGEYKLDFKNTSGLKPATLSIEDTPKTDTPTPTSTPAEVTPEKVDPSKEIIDKEIGTPKRVGGPQTDGDHALDNVARSAVADKATEVAANAPTATIESVATASVPEATDVATAGAPTPTTPEAPIKFSPEQLAKATEVMSNDHFQKQIAALFPKKTGFLDIFGSLFSAPQASILESKDWLAVKDTSVETLLNNNLADPAKASDPDFIKMREYIKSVIAQTNVNPSPSDTAEQYLKNLSDMWARAEISRTNKVVV